MAVGKGSPDVDGASTTSWLNTQVFLRAWEKILKDGRFRRHEWVVKVDPDCVFFPSRLAERLQAHHIYTGGLNLYLGNCGIADGKMYGSMEVFSRGAVEVYGSEGAHCRKELNWKGWGEDLFMESCMNQLGVRHVNAFDMIGDERCRPASCSDPAKVAFHAFKDVPGYFSCWEQSQTATGMDMQEIMRANSRAVCVGQGWNCAKSKCCSDKGFRCYESYPGFALCQTSCDPAQDHMSCQVLGGSPGLVAGASRRLGRGAQRNATEPCSDEGEDCTANRCCKKSLGCYAKHAGYAICMTNCSSSRDRMSCDLLSAAPTSEPPPQKPVRAGRAPPCAGAGENCAASRCCKDSALKCFEEYHGHALCKHNCTPSADKMDCVLLGRETS